MKQKLLLRKFQTSIPSSALVSAGLKKNHIVAEHLPLLNVFIDFEFGKLKLQGDWQFMLASNKHNDTSWAGYHRERVNIEMDIYPSSVLDLNDPYTDGIVFTLEGKIKDANGTGPCSGMVIIDNKRNKKRLISSQWNISFYIYDLQFDFCEIKFTLPVYALTINSYLN